MPSGMIFQYSPEAAGTNTSTKWPSHFCAKVRVLGKACSKDSGHEKGMSWATCDDFLWKHPIE